MSLSVDHSRIMAKSFKLASKFFQELSALFDQGANVAIGASSGQSVPALSQSLGAKSASAIESVTGAKHKSKEEDKSQKKESAQAIKSSVNGDKKGAAAEAKTTEKKKKQKKEKDPAIANIKGPQTAFMIFSNKRRSVIKSEHPNLSITEIAKLLGEEWNMLTESMKAAYKKKAEEEKVEYQLRCEKARRQYQQMGGDAAPVEQAKPKKAAAPATKKVPVDDISSSLSSVESEDGDKTKKTPVKPAKKDIAPAKKVETSKAMPKTNDDFSSDSSDL